MLLADFIKDGTEALSPIYPAKEARNIILMLCERLVGTTAYTHIVDPSFTLTASQVRKLMAARARLETGEPIQYVTGVAEFGDLVFNVTPDVLIPRPETEMLVREAVKIASRLHRMRIPYGKEAPPVRALDLCTGSGCIAWSLALSVPGTRVVGVDISESALKVARRQPFASLVREKGAAAPEFVKADVLTAADSFAYGKFDLILSNPPYIKESEKAEMRRNVLDFEPSLALFVSDDDPLVFYRAIAAWSVRHLAADGVGLTEINDTLGDETRAVFVEAGFREVSIVTDFYDRNRFVHYSGLAL